MGKKILSLIAVLTLISCASGPKSFKQTTLDDMYPILTSEQYDTLTSLNSDEEINQFLNKFWQEIDSTYSITKDELKVEYLWRLEYVNENFPDHLGWGRSDRKRIYLLYGPPYFIERSDYTNDQLGSLSTIKALEIWVYMTPGKYNSFPARGDNVYPGEKKFIFADLTGFGIYTIIFSSEDREDIDIRMYKRR